MFPRNNLPVLNIANRCSLSPSRKIIAPAGHVLLTTRAVRQKSCTGSQISQVYLVDFTSVSYCDYSDRKHWQIWVVRTLPYDEIAGTISSISPFYFPSTNFS